MKIFIKYILIFTYIFFINNSLLAIEKNFGMGISLFYPTGITFKYKWNPKFFFESLIGISEQGGHFHFGIEYDFYDINKNIKLYSGGAFLMEERKRKKKLFRGIFEESRSYYPGIRAPIGFVYYGDNQSFDFFGELSINLLFKESMDGFLGIAIGIRAYF